jgi:hypothetical protein
MDDLIVCIIELLPVSRRENVILIVVEEEDQEVDSVSPVERNTAFTTDRSKALPEG